MSILGKLFGDANARYVNSLLPVVEQINILEKGYESLSDDDLRKLTDDFRLQLRDGGTLDGILPEAFAAAREAAKRTLGQRHFDVQLVGGMVLHQGKIAEMKTGEGKTLVATLPLYLNSLEGKGAHLVTPNDYLSRVGAGWMGPVYHALGVTVGVVTHEWSGIYDPLYQDPERHGDERLGHFRPVSRGEAYRADITYGTNNEFGFDYLRDNLEYLSDHLRQKEHNFAIVDEVDSILIDEARTPLIISAPDEESGELYQTFARLVPQLKEGSDYNVDEKMKAVSITEEGIDKVEKILGLGNIYEEKGIRFVRYLESSLRAQALFHRDKDYVVKPAPTGASGDGQVIIVDEFTGRLMPGRRWSEGLHQAIEAKEGVKVQQESRTLATITFQNYFRMYKKIAGMTGTAQTSAEEFHKVYNLDVITIPTHRPMVREDRADLVFRTQNGKFQAVVRETKERHQKGQPVLIGTVSIEKNERLSKMLEIEGVPHELLNAKNHEREALIIAQAGRAGAVTVATNMAGRGVDIILGDRVQSMGGLHVIGTERHEARRIDNQLRGRSGRQGDLGSSQFFVSLEDELMRIFGSVKIKGLMESLGIPEDQPIEHKMVSRAIEAAQAKIEGFHFDSRKHILEYDDVLNKQRDAIYRMRREILFVGKDSSELREKVLTMFEEEITKLVEFHTTAGLEAEWNIEEIFETLRAMAGVPDDVHGKLREIVAGDSEEKRVEIGKYLLGIIKTGYEAREKAIGPEGSHNIARAVMLRAIDILWMDHLDQMEHLRDSVRLRAYGQRDPLVEYKHEGTRLFRELQAAIRSQIVNTIFKVGGTPQAETPKKIEERRPEITGIMNPSFAEATEGKQGIGSPAKASAVVGRNDLCPCGSGKKYKKCHGA
ncbi:MAG: preprotein translocase subunit SecA [Candidatus Sungbacteria bacterium]|nr:preprotein translocase subunit SecA [Candidatus Sungbacteria bacterium]